MSGYVWLCLVMPGYVWLCLVRSALCLGLTLRILAMTTYVCLSAWSVWSVCLSGLLCLVCLSVSVCVCLVTLKVWLHLVKSGYVWLCLVMSCYVWFCLVLSGYVWLSLLYAWA